MKENIFNYLKNNIVILVISFILFLLSVFEFVYFYNNVNNKNELIDSFENNSYELKDEVKAEKIIVDIKGEIKKPGVYNIKVGSRVNDLINEAGGLSKNANTRFINLSKKLEDGEVVVIYSNKEINDAKKNDKLEVTAPCVCEEVKNDACYNENSTNNNTNNGSKIVNINTASIQELTTLNGIGESKAKAIVSYRDKNGKFKAIKDIMNVSGISETLFSKIKNNITV
ncbi:MAG: helix-hairpin-helix domain-containing protein [Tenericutes bacterium]|nr:helix-hairpin-helix domain-containing protein [Mycoplasmatota bacterium]